MKRYSAQTSILLALVALGTIACDDYTTAICTDANAVDLNLNGTYRATRLDWPTSEFNVSVTKKAPASYDYLADRITENLGDSNRPQAIRACEISGQTYIEVTNSKNLNAKSLIKVEIDADTGSVTATRMQLNIEKTLAAGLRYKLINLGSQFLENSGLTPELVVFLMQVDPWNSITIYTPMPK